MGYDRSEVLRQPLGLWDLLVGQVNRQVVLAKIPVGDEHAGPYDRHSEQDLCRTSTFVYDANKMVDCHPEARNMCT